MNTLREGLPPLPGKMADLYIDERGYPCPWFLAIIDGKHDHRVADGTKMPNAVKLGLCWLCGKPLGRFKSFCIGPMCMISRSIAEPPSHLECVEYAAKVCPFLTRPQAKRRAAGIPEEASHTGEPILRNPAVVCVWTTTKFRVFRVGAGVMFNIGPPEHAEFYSEGRPATRAELDESIRTGLPNLLSSAEAQEVEQPGCGAVAELGQRVARERAWLDGLAWPT